jgi:hypothetical protein
VSTLRLISALALALAPVVASCGGDDPVDPTTTAAASTSAPAASAGLPPDVVAIRASSDIGLGRERLLVGLGGASGRRLGSPDQAMSITVHPEGEPDRAVTEDGTWMWIVEGSTGLYRAEFDFDRPGIWMATVTPEGGAPLDPIPFEVLEDPYAPALGEEAPAPETPTLDDATVEELSSDDDPDPGFYQLSLDEAIGNGNTTVVVFSTPQFCVSAACGPLLDVVKEVAPGHPDVQFVHVEVFAGLTDPDFAPDADHLAPAVGPQWYNLPSEPWVFVVDGGGKVVARYEGVLDRAELEAVLG